MKSNIKYKTKKIKIMKRKRSIRKMNMKKYKGGISGLGGIGEQAKKAAESAATKASGSVPGMPKDIPGMPKDIPGIPKGVPAMPKGVPAMPKGIPAMPKGIPAGPGEALDKMKNLKKLTPAGGIGAILSDVIKTLSTVFGVVLSIPVRNLDELIPEQLCNKFVNNDIVCTQSVMKYILTGIKPDHRKILLDKEEGDKNCIQYHDKGNQFVQCKKGGSSHKNTKFRSRSKPKNRSKSRSNSRSIFDHVTFKGIYGDKYKNVKYRGGANIDEIEGYNGMIIECNSVKPLKFKLNDRVRVKSTKELLDGELKGSSIIIDDKTWFIGTVVSTKGSSSSEYKIKIRIDKNNLTSIIPGVTVTSDNETDIEIYDKDWEDFSNKVYSIFPKKKTWLSKKLSFFTLPSEVMIRLFIKLKTNPELFESILKKESGLLINPVIEHLKKISSDTSAGTASMANNALRGIELLDKTTRVIFEGLSIVSHRIVNGGENVESILRQLIASESEFSEAMNKKLEIILDKLIKVNLYLRKYECPTKKLEYLINNVNDKQLLSSILTICNDLLEENTYKTGVDNRTRGVQCDAQYREIKDKTMNDLELDADMLYSDWYRNDLYDMFHGNEPPEEIKCSSCKSSALWPNLLGKYGCMLSGSLFGSKGDMNYIITNILLDMSSSEKGLAKNDAIRTNITIMLKNIECRSNLREIIRKKIDVLNKLEENAKVKENPQTNIEDAETNDIQNNAKNS